MRLVLLFSLIVSLALARDCIFAFSSDYNSANFVGVLDPADGQLYNVKSFDGTTYGSMLYVTFTYMSLETHNSVGFQSHHAGGLLGAGCKLRSTAFGV